MQSLIWTHPQNVDIGGPKGLKSKDKQYESEPGLAVVHAAWAWPDSNLRLGLAQGTACTSLAIATASTRPRAPGPHPQMESRVCS